MGKVTPLKIDVNNGKLPLKDKGLDMKDFSSVAELRRDQLEKLAAGFRMFAHFGFNEGVAGHITYSCLLYTSPSPRDSRRSRMPSSA